MKEYKPSHAPMSRTSRLEKSGKSSPERGSLRERPFVLIPYGSSIEWYHKVESIFLRISSRSMRPYPPITAPHNSLVTQISRIRILTFSECRTADRTSIRGGNPNPVCHAGATQVGL